MFGAAVVGAIELAAGVSVGSRSESTTDELVAASVERTLTTADRPASVGIIIHSTANAIMTPIAPVVAESPRPIVSGGSDDIHAS